MTKAEKIERNKGYRKEIGDLYETYQNLNTAGLSGMITTEREQKGAIKDLKQDLEATKETARMNEEYDAYMASMSEYKASLDKALAMSAQMAQEGMPQGAYDKATENISASQSSAMRGASSAGDALRMSGLGQQSATQAYRDLAIQDAMMSQNNMNNYINMSSNVAGQKMQADQYGAQLKGQQEYYNDLRPYEMKLNQLQQLRNAIVQGRQQQGQFVLDAVAMGISGGGSEMFQGVSKKSPQVIPNNAYATTPYSDPNAAFSQPNLYTPPAGAPKF